MAVNSIYFKRFTDEQITDGHLELAAKLFSDHYGVWSSSASSHLGPWAICGNKIKMSSRKLRSQCMAGAEKSDGISDLLVVAYDGRGKHLAHVFAVIWGDAEHHRISWIAQVVVHTDWRRQGVATEMLRHIKDMSGNPRLYGVLSSHAATIRACVRVFGNVSLSAFNLDATREHAHHILASSNVPYARNCTPVGSLFEHADIHPVTCVAVTDAVISCAHTNFYVDHAEPDESVRIAKCDSGGLWPLGCLPEGCEFLVVVNDGCH